jgi:hypothetical protein
MKAADWGDFNDYVEYRGHPHCHGSAYCDDARSVFGSIMDDASHIR